MRNKFIALVFGITLLFTGCSHTKGESEKLKVVTTIFPAYDFARTVFGDTAEITLLLKPGSESHSYDPSAKDIVKINDCDLFIYNGGESDAWVDGLLKSADEVNTLRMMDAVEVIPESEDGIMEGESGEADEYDEHIWTSPRNAALILQGVENEAEKLAPENSAVYKSRAENFVNSINELDERFQKLLDDEERYFIFADRFPLLYFFRDYGLNYYAAFPGCGSETEPSAQTVAFLADKLKDDDVVKTVFYIELSNHKLADTLAEESSLSTSEFHTCHNISADDYAAGETYLSLMERNYFTIKNALEN